LALMRLPRRRSSPRAAQHLPGDEAWLVCEERAAAGERKYHLANPTSLRALAAAIKARWVCSTCGSGETRGRTPQRRPATSALASRSAPTASRRYSPTSADVPDAVTSRLIA
jgi:hypothetical protein